MIRSGPYLVLLMWAALLAPLLVRPAVADDLAARRSERREQIRAASLRVDKAGSSALFGLLVIPVDFADARLPDGYEPGLDLSPRLVGASGETLHNFFATSSGGRCDLRVTLAPTVHLPGARRDYLEGFASSPHTRTMATLALESVADTGFPFRELDMDGPDGHPGTADDDGRVDGVLLLHAGSGTEDGGVIPAHQFYLEEPVIQDGVAADTYAVAGYRSGLGIWAHETLHMFGLEERYDPLLPSDAGASEIHSRGGLGIFSVMAAGAWGTGEGHGCALVDGYSGWQLGWFDEVGISGRGLGHRIEPSVTGRQVHRVWTNGEPGHEFFLIEVRDPVAAAPFDAAVPGGSLVIYHVDETVPDGWRVVTGSEYHLRARLVEADGDDGLRRGLDEGSGADLFPGTLGIDAWTPTTHPNSDGYAGPSHVSLTGITSVDRAVDLIARADDGPAIRHELAFGDEAEPVLELVVFSLAGELEAPTATLTALPPARGYFAGGGTSSGFDLVPQGGYERLVPDRAIAWIPDLDLPAGSATVFRLQISTPDWDSAPLESTWHWDGNAAALAFTGVAPGGWEVDHPDGTGGATWHLWSDPANPVVDGRPLFACTGVGDDTPTAWPNVVYGFGAHARLTSPPLGPGVEAVRIVHAWDAEILPTGTGMDGGTVTWVDADGREHPAVPVDGWPGAVAVESSSAIHGRNAFTGPMTLDENERPLWRVDVFPLPTDLPGPWRLCFAFASNSRNGDGLRRGWILAEATALTTLVPASAWQLSWTGDSLNWGPPPGGTGAAAVILRRVDGVLIDLSTPPLVPDPAAGGHAVPASLIRTHLPGPDRTRHVLLVAEEMAYGTLVSRPVVVQLDGGAGTTPFAGAPWPNPATSELSFTLDVPDGAKLRWRIYDVQGRLLREESRTAGSHLIRWDGRDRAGRRAPAGVYFVKITGATVERTHKVVLLH
ncbi:MAG: T9SS type A sorting domain-containing protein [bacterium]|nr:T9SS type A sorting domain-containing protein [bacterium]